VNGLVTTATVRMPSERATSAMTGAAPVPVEGLDDHVIVLDQLDELEWAGPHRAKGQPLVALLDGVLRRHDREVDEPVEERRVGLAQHEIDVHHLEIDVGLARRIGADRHQIIRAGDLHAMAGVVEQRDVGALNLPAEILHG